MLNRIPLHAYKNPDCRTCQSVKELPFDFSMAFQPIIDAERKQIYSQEALVRGLHNESAADIFQLINDDNLYLFDQSCRVKAIQLASKLGLQSKLNINFLPNAIYDPERCIRTTLDAAQRYSFPLHRIVFEIVESERITDIKHMQNIVDYYKDSGFLTAIDDFGAGYSGLNLLAQLQTDIVKLDRELIINIHQDYKRSAIVRAVVQMCRELSIDIIAEGIEIQDEYTALRDLGVVYFQGYYFARPQFEQLPQVDPLLFAGA